METAQLPFNRKCDKNMFRFYRLSLFSLSANNVAFFAEIWLGAVEPFTSSNLTPGVRGALVLDLGEKVLWTLRSPKHLLEKHNFIKWPTFTSCSWGIKESENRKEWGTYTHVDGEREIILCVYIYNETILRKMDEKVSYKMRLLTSQGEDV